MQKFKTDTLNLLLSNRRKCELSTTLFVKSVTPIYRARKTLYSGILTVTSVVLPTTFLLRESRFMKIIRRLMLNEKTIENKVARRLARKISNAKVFSSVPPRPLFKHAKIILKIKLLFM